MKKHRLFFRFLAVILTIALVMPVLSPLAAAAESSDLSELESILDEPSELDGILEELDLDELDDTLNELDDILDELESLLNDLDEMDESELNELESILDELIELDDILNEELMGSTNRPRRAIYILPGYSANRLYSQRFFGMPIWIGPGIVTDIGLHLLGGRLGRESELVNNEDGTGMSAFVNRRCDRVGSLPLYIPMMISLRIALIRNGLHRTYNIEFFPYNFIGDLNEAARELADDIREKGYESVTLIGHSNGGLVASAFAAHSEENRNMIDHAILIGTPLWGTYLGLEMIETGALTLFDGTFYMSLINAFYSTVLRPISRRWIMDWSRNSPNLYQMSPGQEYISRIPFLYRTADGTRAVTEMDEVYAILNRSPNMNSNLVDGNERSLRYMLETVYDGDVLSIWEGVNVTLVGNQYGRLTPTTVVYRQHGSEALFDGNIFSRDGDGIVIRASMNGDGRFDFIDIPNRLGHVMMVMTPRTISTINDLVLGRPVTLSEYDTDLLRSSDDIGMSDMIRVEIKSSDPLSATLRNSGIRVVIRNRNGRIVANATGDTQFGFWDNDFVYSAWSNAQHETNILLYIPKEGYTMEVFTGNLNPRSSDINVSTQTLSHSGAILSRNEYRLRGANLLSRSIFTLSGSRSMTPTARSGATRTAISAQTFEQDWTFTSDTLHLESGMSLIPEISGSDAARANMSDYDWRSSHPDVVSVSDDGLITANAPGTATITAIGRSEGLKMEILSVTVSE